MRVPLFVDGCAVALINYPDVSVGRANGHLYKIGDKTEVNVDLVMVWAPDPKGKLLKGYVAFPRDAASAEVAKTALFKDHVQKSVKPQHVPAFTEAFKAALGC